MIFTLFHYNYVDLHCIYTTFSIILIILKIISVMTGSGFRASRYLPRPGLIGYCHPLIFANL